ncbi:MAG: histidinol-phosphatase [Bacteroidetes bacterium]|nr:MAG: histidinol-phosphatase [Bacteroidota bacterium]
MHLSTTSLFLSILVYLCSPATLPAQNWYKGNLHTHSYWSDGDEFPEPVMDWYKTHGYHFVAMSDHNTLAAGEKWKKIRPDTLYRNAFKTYLSKYGPDWVEYQQEGDELRVRLKTLEDYRPLFEEPGRFLIIQAEEITETFERRPLHLNATNIQELVQPQGGRSAVEVLQNNIDAVHRQRAETGVPMMVHLNHPNYKYGITLEDIVELSGERFFEVFNGHPAVQNLGDSQHISTETMWDLVNIAYVRQGKPLIYGLATDDSHHYHQFGRKFCNSGRGWVVVRADSLEAGALIEAMEAGDFYASTGVELKKVRFGKNKLRVQVKKARGAQYTIEFIGCTNGDNQTYVLNRKKGSRGSFRLTPDLAFVRARIRSDRSPANPTEPEQVETAWTQPVQFMPAGR